MRQTWELGRVVRTGAAPLAWAYQPSTGRETHINLHTLEVLSEREAARILFEAKFGG